MKIALIDPSLFTLPYDRALADGLQHNGHEVRLYGKYLPANDPGKNSPLLRELFYPGFERRAARRLPQPVFLGLKGLMHPLCLHALKGRLKKWQPDIIHFQWIPLPAIDRFFLASFRRTAPLVLTVHDSMPFNGNPRGQLQRLGAIAAMNDFDRLIVHTEEARRRLTGYGVPAAKIARIPHGLLDLGGKHSIAPPEARETVTLLLLGKIKPYKGTDILIRALAALPPDLRARCRLRVAGQPFMDMEPLFALARESNVADRIDWDLRFLDEAEMNAAFAAADIIAMPYRQIDASGVLMAALEAGKPILASRMGLFAEMLEDGKHGHLVPPENPQALAQALADLIGNGQKRLAMGREVRTLRDAIPDWTEIARLTEDVYRQLLTGTGERRAGRQISRNHIQIEAL